MVEIMNKESLSMTSNQQVSMKGNNEEEQIVAQMIEAMDIIEQDPTCNKYGDDEVESHHSFLKFMFYKAINIVEVFFRIYSSKYFLKISSKDVRKLCVISWTDLFIMNKTDTKHVLTMLQVRVQPF
jgi:hypothetical protein